MKWDGVRVLSYLNDNRIHLFNRKKNERTHHYPELTSPELYSAQSLIIDGEIVSFKDGKPSFYEVMKRDGLRNLDKVLSVAQNIPITYLVFDILFYNGEWVTSMSLEERQSLLGEIVRTNDHLQLVENSTDNVALFDAVQANDLEGVVYKDLTKPYVINGKDNRWRKKKNHKDLIAVVGGVTYRSSIVNSLLLGLYDQEGKLWYIGSVGGGRVSQQEWRELTRGIEGIVQAHNPFVNQPSGVRAVTWVRPHLTVKIQYMEWVKGHSVRQPSILAFVNVPPEECIIE